MNNEENERTSYEKLTALVELQQSYIETLENHIKTLEDEIQTLSGDKECECPQEPTYIKIYYKITIHFTSGDVETLIIPEECIRYFSEYLLGNNIRDIGIEQIKEAKNG